MLGCFIIGTSALPSDSTKNAWGTSSPLLSSSLADCFKASSNSGAALIVFFVFLSAFSASFAAFFAAFAASFAASFAATFAAFAASFAAAFSAFAASRAASFSAFFAAFSSSASLPLLPHAFSFSAFFAAFASSRSCFASSRAFALSASRAAFFSNFKASRSNLFSSRSNSALLFLLHLITLTTTRYTSLALPHLPHSLTYAHPHTLHDPIHDEPLLPPHSPSPPTSTHSKPPTPHDINDQFISTTHYRLQTTRTTASSLSCYVVLL